MNSLHPILHTNRLYGELLGILLIVLCAFFWGTYKRISPRNLPASVTNDTFRGQPNVHEIYYSIYHEKLESRFPFRRRNDPLAYIRQVFMVFGGATLFILICLKKMHLPKSFGDVTGWKVSFLCCVFNATFSYVFGFVAVTYDWWLFFPDLITGHIWQIKRGQMVLGDVFFYPMAIFMGHLGVLLVKRMKNPVRHPGFDNFLKIVWFAVALAITCWGIMFGLSVMKGMIYSLYIPFGIAGLLFFRRYTGFELWSTTCLFIICEFLWDLVARIEGVWIFPDSSTHPGLYLKEIVFAYIGQFPVVWQPEMTQMAFSSGMVCLVFHHLSCFIFRKKEICSSVTPSLSLPVPSLSFPPHSGGSSEEVKRLGKLKWKIRTPRRESANLPD